MLLPCLAAGEVKDFGGDFLLAPLVVLEGEFRQEVFAVVCGGLHGHGAGGVFCRGTVQKCGKELQFDGLGIKGVQKLLAGGLQDDVRRFPVRAGND